MNGCHCTTHITLWVPLHHPNRPGKPLNKHSTTMIHCFFLVTPETPWKTELCFLPWHESIKSNFRCSWSMSSKPNQVCTTKTLMKTRHRLPGQMPYIWLLSGLEATPSLQCSHDSIAFCRSEVNSWEDYYCYTSRVWMEHKRMKIKPLTLPLQQINKARSAGRGSILDQVIHLEK